LRWLPAGRNGDFGACYFFSSERPRAQLFQRTNLPFGYRHSSGNCLVDSGRGHKPTIEILAPLASFLYPRVDFGLRSSPNYNLSFS
jgi:hypothetical protein